MKKINRHPCNCNSCFREYRDPKAPTNLIREKGCYANDSRIINGIWYCDFWGVRLKRKELIGLPEGLHV